MRDVFSDIYKTNYWKSDQSASGHGSDLGSTEVVRSALPALLERLEVRSLLDIPCGDFYWMDKVDLAGIDYIGADIVPELIEQNRRDYPGRYFSTLDLTSSKLPRVDLVLVRDCLGHLSNANVSLALKNLRASGSRYLLVTTFPNWENKGDIKDGEWRPINLASLFGLPDAIEYINERCNVADGKFADKSLGLWRIN